MLKLGNTDIYRLTRDTTIVNDRDKPSRYENMVITGVTKDRSKGTGQHELTGSKLSNSMEGDYRTRKHEAKEQEEAKEKEEGEQEEQEEEE